MGMIAGNGRKCLTLLILNMYDKIYGRVRDLVILRGIYVQKKVICIFRTTHNNVICRLQYRAFTRQRLR